MPLFAEGTGVPLEDMQHNLNGTLNGRSNNSTGQDPTSTNTESTMTPSEGQVPDRIRIKNRRKRYLDLHPEYFGPQLELAGMYLEFVHSKFPNPIRVPHRDIRFGWAFFFVCLCISADLPT